MLNKFFTGDRTPTYKEKLSTQLALTCRVIVGGYLLYLAYGLKDSVMNAEYAFRSIMFLIALLLFALAGAYFTYTSARDLLIGRYVGGKLDLGEEPKEEVETELSEEKDETIS